METANNSLHFYFQPKQFELVKAYETLPHTIYGYGGSRGGAKSHLGRNLIVYRRWKYANTPAFIIRKTIDDLRDNHIRPMMQEQPRLAYYFNKQEKLIQFPNGSTIRFISSDNHDDIFRLIGKEAADVFLDQAEQFDQEQIEFLSTVNRCVSNNKITAKMLLTFNPGDVGHQYLKRIFVKKEYVGNERPGDYFFLRAYGWDNYRWVEKYLSGISQSASYYYSLSDAERFNMFIERSDYGQKLNSLPDAQRKAQLYGDFDVFEGQFFWMWRDAIHIIPPFQYQPDSGMTLLGGLDYGQRTVLEVAGRDYDGNVTIFAENYTEQMTPAERAMSMCDMLMERKLYNLRIVYDTNMDIDLSKYYPAEGTPIKVYRDVCTSKMGAMAPSFHVVSKYTTDNRGYRVLANEIFMNGLDPGKDKKPKLRITRDCKYLVDSVPNFIADPNSIEGLDFMRGVTMEDPYDAAKMAYMEIRRPLKPKPEKPSWVSELIQQQTEGGKGWSLGK